jgi:RNA polymerase sigma-70 factor (ECF subfamily)
MPSDPEFERLVDLYYRDLYRFSFSLTRNEPDAADLTQETFYIWAQKRHQIRDAGKVKTWLFTTLHRQFLNTRRRLARFSDEPVSDTMGDLPAVDPKVVNRIDVATMLDFFAQIDQGYRVALMLYYMEDLSYREIAEVLNVPLGTVQSRISRGKQHLHQLLTTAPRSTEDRTK